MHLYYFTSILVVSSKLIKLNIFLITSCVTVNTTSWCSDGLFTDWKQICIFEFPTSWSPVKASWAGNCLIRISNLNRKLILSLKFIRLKTLYIFNELGAVWKLKWPSSFFLIVEFWRWICSALVGPNPRSYPNSQSGRRRSPHKYASIVLGPSWTSKLVNCWFVVFCLCQSHLSVKTEVCFNLVLLK